MKNAKERACGRWTEILVQLGIPPEIINGKHHPCPVCGGTDRFRFDDQDGRGTYYCNQCGPGDGFSLLEKVLRLSGFREAAETVLECLGEVGHGNDMKTSNKDKVNPQDIQKKCQLILDSSIAANPDHNYLKKKQIKAFEIKEYKGLLVLPVKVAGTLSSLHFINEDGRKMFIKGGKIKGGYHLLRSKDDLKKRVVIAEGVATAASIRYFTGYNVLIAFNASNLMTVSSYVREKLPDAVIVFAADNDLTTEVNTGLEKALAASRYVNGIVVPAPAKEDKNWDWNDFLVEHGAENASNKFKELLDLELKALTVEPKSTIDSEAFEVETMGVQIIKASAFQVKGIKWLWKDWLASGKLHLLAGVAGTGKTTIALDFAANISQGAMWPDGTIAPAGSALIWSGEDDIEDSLAPRLVAAGANLEKVHFIGSVATSLNQTRSFDPAKDISILEQKVQQIKDLRLIIIDPISVAVNGDSHKNTDVRRGLQSIVDLARSAGAAVLGITHFNKNSAGSEPLDRVTGSHAFGALARLVMVVEKTRHKHILRCIKSNVGPTGAGYEYNLKQVDLDEDITAQRIVWYDKLNERDTDSILQKERGKTKKKLNNAQKWLLNLLEGDGAFVAVIQEQAEQQGYSWRTIQRASNELGVVAKKQGFGGGVKWALPMDSV